MVQCSRYSNNGQIDTRRQIVDRPETRKSVDFPVRSADRIDRAGIRMLADGLDQAAPDDLLVGACTDQGE